MSISNAEQFFAKIESDSDLQSKAGQIFERSRVLVSEELAKLSQEVGTPVAASDIAVALKDRSSALTEGELDNVSGGIFWPHRVDRTHGNSPKDPAVGA
jgi:hypothetical protein